jgi:hypothetical protein
MIISNIQRMKLVRDLFYFVHDLLLIIQDTEKMIVEQKYLTQREWIDFCVRKQDVTQTIVKKIWTWIKKDES